MDLQQQYTYEQAIKKNYAKIRIHSKKSHTITNMNDNINMDSTIAGSINDNINMDSTIARSINARS